MTLTVGFLSAAHSHSDAYADILVDKDDVGLAGVVDSDADRGREFAERHRTEYVEEADDLLESVDAAIICAPNADHREWFERAAAANVDVLCEKPLATTVDNARAMVECWRETEITAGLAMPLRFCEPARRTMAALEAGDIGNLLSVSGTNRGKMPGGWFADPDAAGAGAVMDHTVHIVDLIYDLVGEEVVEVYAELDTRFHDISVDDVNVLSMELADGTPFLLDGSWSRPDAWHTWGDATIELTGTDGTVALDYTDQSLTYTVDSGPDAGVGKAFYGTDANAALIDDFLESVHTGTDPAIAPDDGLRVVAVVEAAIESAERAEPVEVTY